MLLWIFVVFVPNGQLFSNLNSLLEHFSHETDFSQSRPGEEGGGRIVAHCRKNFRLSCCNTLFHSGLYENVCKIKCLPSLEKINVAQCKLLTPFLGNWITYLNIGFCFFIFLNGPLCMAWVTLKAGVSCYFVAAVIFFFTT